MNIQISYGAIPLNIDILKWDNNSKTIEYRVAGTNIHTYDQHSRARVGIKFKDYKVSEEPKYIVYTQVYKLMQQNNNFKEKIFNTLALLEQLRDRENIEKEKFNLMSRECSYIVGQDINSLRGQMQRRLKLCEEETIVSMHWKLRDKMIKMGIEEAKSFLPGCDTIKKCDYSSADYLSNAFGCLFASCNRQKSSSNYASFNQSCTTPELLEEQLGIKIPRSEYEMSLKRELINE